MRSQLADLGQQYQDTLENTDSFFVRWNATTNAIIYCNEQYAQMWHKTKADMIGTQITDYQTVEERESFKSSMARYKANETRSEISTYTDSEGNVRSAHVLNRAISRDNKTVDEFHAHGVDCTDEVNYNNAVQKLFPVFADETLEFKDKMEELLRIGLEYFELDTAKITSVQSDSCEITCIVGDDPDNFAAGVNQTTNTQLSTALIESGDCLTINGTDSASTIANDSNIQSYIGAVIQDGNDAYGVLEFSAPHTREKPYDAQDESLCLLIGSWVGFLIGNQGQINFMSNQTEYYKDLFFSVPAMMLLCDKEGVILSASDKLCERLKFSSADVAGKNCHELLDVDDTYALKAALDGGSAQHIPLTLTLTDSSTVDVELNSRIKPIGTLRGVRMVVLSDVSARNTAFKRVEEQNHKLESCLLYTSPSPRDQRGSRMPSSA